MMSREANVKAILECNFTGFKDEIIDTAVELICDLECEPITSPSQHMAKQAENFGEIAMNEIDKARSCEDCISRKDTIEWLKKVTVTEGIEFKTGFEQILYDIEQMPSVNPEGENFTDDEKRIFLASVAREMRVCEVIDSEKTKVKLVPILERVKDKVLRSSLWKEVEE